MWGTTLCLLCERGGLMTNPLIAKWEELNKKKEEPKPQKTHTEKLKELRDTSTVPVNTPNIITAKQMLPSFKTYDIDSINDSFLQIAEKVKNKKAQVVSMNMEMGHPIGKCLVPKTLTFEVIVYEDTP
jgi:uncharacterized protein (DUF342 family)